MAKEQAEKPASGAQGRATGTDGGQAAADTPEPGNGRTAPQSDRDVVADLSIHSRMVAILAELPAIGKDQRNTEQDFMFRGHDQILNALNPLLAKYGVFVVPEVLERITDQRQTRNNRVMFEVNLHVRFRFYGVKGDYIEASTWGEGTDMGDKATNKAMTMAFKNVLNQAFSISSQEFKDADGETPESVVTRGATAEQRAERFRGKILTLCERLDTQTEQEAGFWRAAIEEAAQRDFGVPFSDLETNELEDIGKYLKAQIDQEITAPPEQIVPVAF